MHILVHLVFATLSTTSLGRDAREIQGVHTHDDHATRQLKTVLEAIWKAMLQATLDLHCCAGVLEEATDVHTGRNMPLCAPSQAEISTEKGLISEPTANSKRSHKACTVVILYLD